MVKLLDNITFISLIGLTIIIWILFFGFIYEIISHLITKHQSNKEWLKENGKKLRKKCLDCSYCVKKKYDPYSYIGYSFTNLNKIPIYCKRLKVNLNGNSTMRCVAEFNKDALYEE